MERGLARGLAWIIPLEGSDRNSIWGSLRNG
jgi:hypothetical protein